MENDGRTYGEVTVEVIEITTDAVEANIYVSETDITTEQFIDLVETDLGAAIEAQDNNEYFSSIQSVSGDSQLGSEDDGNDKSSDFPWEWVIAVFVQVLLIIILGGLYDCFCVNKVNNDETEEVVPAMEPRTNTNTNANTLEMKPELPNEEELIESVLMNGHPIDAEIGDKDDAVIVIDGEGA